MSENSLLFFLCMIIPAIIIGLIIRATRKNKSTINHCDLKFINKFDFQEKSPGPLVYGSPIWLALLMDGPTEDFTIFEFLINNDQKISIKIPKHKVNSSLTKKLESINNKIIIENFYYKNFYMSFYIYKNSKISFFSKFKDIGDFYFKNNLAKLVSFDPQATQINKENHENQ